MKSVTRVRRSSFPVDADQLSFELDFSCPKKGGFALYGIFNGTCMWHVGLLDATETHEPRWRGVRPRGAVLGEARCVLP
jgi:hypothetical protein